MLKWKLINSTNTMTQFKIIELKSNPSFSCANPSSAPACSLYNDKLSEHEGWGKCDIKYVHKFKKHLRLRESALKNSTEKTRVLCKGCLCEVSYTCVKCGD